MNYQCQLDQVTRFFETIARENIDRIDDLYGQDAYFKDPFNEVHGLKNIKAIFEHMFEQVDDPEFVITQSISQDNQTFLLWEFAYAIKGMHNRLHIHGGTHLRFDSEGKIVHHRDYWDAAEELYEKLPVLKYLMKFLRNRVRS
jgi:limonene-1,2-epoxide hydrolase